MYIYITKYMLPYGKNVVICVYLYSTMKYGGYLPFLQGTVSNTTDQSSSSQYLLKKIGYYDICALRETHNHYIIDRP